MNRFLNQILHGNSVDVMKKIPNNSIDYALTSPPYDSLISYNNKITDKKFDDYFTFPFVEMATELYRVMKEGFWNNIKNGKTK